jgi:hypothetical protein
VLTGVSFSGGEPVVPRLVAGGAGLKLVGSTTSVLEFYQWTRLSPIQLWI